MRVWPIWIAVWALLGACSLDVIGLAVAPGWQVNSVVAMRNSSPDKLAFSSNGKWLYMTCDTPASSMAPSLLAVNMDTGRHLVLLSGLQLPSGLTLAPDGSLWIGEAFAEGLIWRIAEPDDFPGEQRVERASMEATDPSVASLEAAGSFAHRGMAFSVDKRFAYLADASESGAIYRYSLHNRDLAVLRDGQGWLPVSQPDDARQTAIQLQARMFRMPKDLTMLPDGRLLILEAATGSVFVLDDRGQTPALSLYLHDDQLQDANSIAWDDKRQWLWISEGSETSHLWSWDGAHLARMATRKLGPISGIAVRQGIVYLNLQRKTPGAEITVRMDEIPG